MPQLALSHETSADGKTVTIKLRPGVKFHDGEAFDAAAAKYSLDRHLNMKGSFRKPELGSVDKVEVVDPLTIKLNLKAPFSPLLAQLTDRAGMMVSPKAAEAAGDKFGLKPVCAGPYKFVERVQQDRIVVEKFADYWNKDQVFIDKITYLPIVDGTVRLANLRSGGLDLIERVLATDIKTVRDNPKLKLIKAVSSSATWASPINLANGPKANTPLAKDARVRRAFELAIDRDALNQVVFNGEFVPGNQWINPTEPLLSADASRCPSATSPRPRRCSRRPASPARSRSTSWCPTAPRRAPVAEVVQSMAAEAGFDLKIRVTEFATSLKQAEDGDYQLYLIGWSGRSDPDGNSFSFQTCGAPQNNCELLRQGRRRRARARRAPRAIPPSARRPTRRSPSKYLADGSIMYLYHRRCWSR